MTDKLWRITKRMMTMRVLGDNQWTDSGLLLKEAADILQHIGAVRHGQSSLVVVRLRRKQSASGRPRSERIWLPADRTTWRERLLLVKRTAFLALAESIQYPRRQIRQIRCFVLHAVYERANELAGTREMGNPRRF